VEIAGTVSLAAVLFVATNIDDVFVLLSFFADPRYRSSQIVFGQYLGIAALVLISLTASLISLVLAPAYIGLLGLVPIAIGVRNLLALRHQADAAEERKEAGVGNILAVAGVTIANGGDNIGVYTPVFATSGAAAIIVTVGVFAVMIALWLAFSHWLVNHPALGPTIGRVGRIATPCVLIALGLFILYDAGSFALLASTTATAPAPTS
jgi:cadmium resistance protein CadD (predicted permease)